ncbi:MAG: DJ-1/PfpI family protein [Candidatus Heimdallarchaeota archaeon]|nr:DJ-1/PfpI family protein [Candidatus Heimdallarchaeota archaeon]
MKIIEKLFVFILLVICVFSIIPSKNENLDGIQVFDNIEYSLLGTKSIEDMKVVLIIGTYFGDSYFWLKEQFEAFGCEVTTAGTTSLVASCPNKPQRPVAPNISVYDMTQEIIKGYDCIIIPAGAHWNNLIFNTAVHNILNIAYDEDLIVGGFCIGSLVLAYADDLVVGKKVCYYSGSYTKMTEVGAEIVYGTGVVSDQRLITAGTGVYNSTNVNVYPFSVAISKTFLGLSGIANIKVTPTRGSINETYTISAEVSDLKNIFGVNYSNAIEHLKGTIHSKNEETEDKDVYLYDLDKDDIFVANYTSTVKGPFTIDFEIEGDSYGIEIFRNAVDFKVKALSGFNWLIAIPVMFSLVGITNIILANRKKHS